MEDRTKELTERLEIKKKIGELDRFPGPLSEYNELKDEKYTIMDTERREKYVYLDGWKSQQMVEDATLKKLVQGGCVGVIHYVPLYPTTSNGGTNGGYGIPVKKIPVLEGRAVDK